MNGLFATGTDSQAGLELDRGGRGDIGGTKAEFGVSLGAGRDRCEDQSMWKPGPRGGSGLAAYREPHSSSCARSSASSSSVRASVSLCETCFEGIGRRIGLRGGGDRDNPAAVRAFTRHGPISGGNFQPATAGAKESQETIAGFSVGLRRSRSAQPDLCPALGAVDPLGTVGLHFQFFTAPAGHPRHDKSLVVSGSWREEMDAFS